MPYCELSGVGPVVKNLVSHSNIKTKSRAFPNIQKKTFYSLGLKRFFRAKVSTRALRSMDKMGGFDVYLMKQKDSFLSHRMLRVKNLLSKKINQQKKVKKQVVEMKSTEGPVKQSGKEP